MCAMLHRTMLRLDVHTRRCEKHIDPWLCISDISTGRVIVAFAHFVAVSRGCTLFKRLCENPTKAARARLLASILVLQARIVGLNAQYFLKNGGFYVISIKASCIDSTAQPEAVFAREVKKLSEMLLKPKEQVTLEPYERDHAMVAGVFRPPPKAKAAA